MGVLERFSDIIASNVNAMLDKLEDPKKMIDQMMRNLMEDLAEVKKDTANVMAEEKRCKRILDEATQNVTKYEQLAIKAVQAGNDADATVFLTEKNNALQKQQSAMTTWQTAKSNADKMRQMHDKLVSDINILKQRQESIKATISVAKTQQSINKMGGINADATMSKFNSYEQKAQMMFDSAQAEAELNQAPVNQADELAKNYNISGGSVDSELAALKASLGMTGE